MSEQFQEILDIPREFIKDGMQFINRCQKRTWKPSSPLGQDEASHGWVH